MVFDLIEYRAELVIGQVVEKPCVQVTGLSHRNEGDTLKSPNIRYI